MSYQDDDAGEGYEMDDGELIAFYTDDAVTELAGVIGGVIEAHEEDPKDSLLSTPVGQLAKSYMEIWLNAMVADEGLEQPLLDNKTSLSELLLFIATKQAEMDLSASGGHIN